MKTEVLNEFLIELYNLIIICINKLLDNKFEVRSGHFINQWKLCVIVWLLSFGLDWRCPDTNMDTLLSYRSCNRGHNHGINWSLVHQKVINHTLNITTYSLFEIISIIIFIPKYIA